MKETKWSDSITVGELIEELSKLPKHLHVFGLQSGGYISNLSANSIEVRSKKYDFIIGDELNDDFVFITGDE